MEPQFLLIVASTVGTAIWGVLTWLEQVQVENLREEEEIYQLYVNPFLMASEDLNHLLYRILVKKEIEFLQTRNVDNHQEISEQDALEIIFNITRYFGWSSLFIRFGSYSSVGEGIQIVRKISELFSDREEFGDDPFRFSPAMQISLARVYLTKVPGDFQKPLTFFNHTFFHFVQQYQESKEKDGIFYQELSKSVNGIKSSFSSLELPGRARLSAIQNELVNIVKFIEFEEKFEISAQTRKKAKLIGDQIIVVDSPVLKEAENPMYFLFNLLPLPIADKLKDSFPSLPFVELEVQHSNSQKVKILHSIPGRVRITVKGSRDQGKTQLLTSKIQSITGVTSVENNFNASSFTIYYDSSIELIVFEAMLLETIDA
jgi:hypothetical protein